MLDNTKWSEIWNKYNEENYIPIGVCIFNELTEWLEKKYLPPKEKILSAFERSKCPRKQ